MKVVRNRRSTEFQIKSGNKYVIVASLVPWASVKNLNKYELYFYYYGEEYKKGTYVCQHINENVSMTVRQEEYENWNDFIMRISKIVSKKLYIIGSSILNEIKYIEPIEFSPY